MKYIAIILEFVLLLAIGGLTVRMFLTDVGKPWYPIYVKCNDERYRKPYLAEDYHLVPIKWLLLTVLVGVPVLISVVLLITNSAFPKSKFRRRRSSQTKWKSGLFDIFNLLCLYYTGTFILMLLCKASSVIGGTPSPYFLTLCAPSCTNITRAHRDVLSGDTYVTLDSCRLEDNKLIRSSNIYSSFPSLHSALCFYATTFMTVFCILRGTISYTRLLQPSIVVFMTAMTIVTSLSRITEYTSHVEDVLGGAGLGCLFGFVQAYLMDSSQDPDMRVNK